MLSSLLIIAADSLPIEPFATLAGAVSRNKRPPNMRLKLAALLLKGTVC